MGWGADNLFFLQDIALQFSSSQVRAVHSKQRHNRVVFWLRACSNQLSDRNPRHSISEKRNVHLTCTRGISSLLCNWLMSPPSSWPSIQGNVSKYDAGGARQHRLLYIMIFFWQSYYSSSDISQVNLRIDRPIFRIFRSTVTSATWTVRIYTPPTHSPLPECSSLYCYRQLFCWLSEISQRIYL